MVLWSKDDGDSNREILWKNETMGRLFFFVSELNGKTFVNGKMMIKSASLPGVLCVGEGGVDVKKGVC